jgi:hypothetical protein
MDLITINISGTAFLVPRASIINIPTSKLALALHTERNYDHKLAAHYFDRRPDLFYTILQAHREGEVHIPSEACANEILQELDYWNIPRSMIARCCVSKVSAANTERKIANDVREEIVGDFERCVQRIARSTGWKKAATKAWIFLEFPVSSGSAKVDILCCP